MNWLTPHLVKRTETNISPCWSLVCDVFEDRLGIKLKNFQINPQQHDKINDQFCIESQEWTRVDDGLLYDVVAMGKSDKIHHVGICLGGDSVLHTGEGRLPRVERIIELSNIYRRIEFYRYGSSS